MKIALEEHFVNKDLLDYCVNADISEKTREKVCHLNAKAIMKIR